MAPSIQEGSKFIRATHLLQGYAVLARDADHPRGDVVDAPLLRRYSTPAVEYLLLFRRLVGRQAAAAAAARHRCTFGCKMVHLAHVVLMVHSTNRMVSTYSARSRCASAVCSAPAGPSTLAKMLQMVQMIKVVQMVQLVQMKFCWYIRCMRTAHRCGREQRRAAFVVERRLQARGDWQ